MLRVLPSGSMTYFFQYRNVKGRQQNYRIGGVGSLKPRQARDIAEDLSGKILSGIDIQKERKEERAKGEKEKYQTWSAFLEYQFKPWVLEHRRHGAETLKRLDTHFSDLKDRPLSEINAWIVEKWRAKRLKGGVSKSTLNRDVGDLKAALTKAVEWRLLESSPLTSLKPFKVDERAIVRYLSEDEETRLRNALKVRDDTIKAKRMSANSWRLRRGHKPLPDLSACTYGDYLSPMVLLAKNTGLRRGELFNLRWSDVNFVAKQLTVRGEKAKSGQTRHIPMNEEALSVLMSWRTQTVEKGLVFATENGTALTTIKDSWSSLLRKAKIENFRFHDLRHDFASKLVMASYN